MSAVSVQPSSPPRPHPRGPLSDEISRSVVRLHKELSGRGPTKARTYISDDLVVCVLRGGFTTPDRTLLKHGKADMVVRQRQALAGALRQPLIDMVERLVGRRVIGFTSGLQPEGEISTEVFLLEPECPARDGM
jgi:uncharacterized protein YbcI